MVEKFIENLNKAASLLQTADHLVYLTYPIVREKRLLLKVLNEIYLVIVNIANSILQYEYFNKRINLYHNASDNFFVFKNKCAPRYGISPEQIKKIEEIFDLAEKHKNSPFEFVRNDKIVIMTDAMKMGTLTVEKIKEYVFLSKDLLRKAETRIKNKE